MRRADRLFDIIQSLRTASQPVTAATLAEELEVTVRTIYRDIAVLQASRVPIEGAPGLGYALRRGFDLPPLMFTAEEADAIAIGVRLLRRLRDAIHEARKVAITYVDEAGHHTQRTIRPIAMAYYVDVTLLDAWCELRNDFRNFRVDRILGAELLDERFTAESAKLTAAWLANQSDARSLESSGGLPRASAGSSGRLP